MTTPQIVRSFMGQRAPSADVVAALLTLVAVHCSLVDIVTSVGRVKAPVYSPAVLLLRIQPLAGLGERRTPTAIFRLISGSHRAMTTAAGYGHSEDAGRPDSVVAQFVRATGHPIPRGGLRMHLKRLLLLLGATALCLATLAPAVSASPRSGDLAVTKNCATYAGAAGDFCTITSSSLNAIKVGSRVYYLQAADFGTLTLSSDIIIDGPGSNTVYGHVTLDLTTGLGTVTISGGTGVFSGFHASVAVSPLGGPEFAWEGTYSFSPAG